MKEPSQTTVILGCGWLGQIVGEAQRKRGISVFGSYRRKEVQETLTKKGIQGFYLDFDESLEIPKDIREQATHLILFIPPSASKKYNYPDLLVNLVAQFSENVKVIFSSSSGVYPKEAGVYDDEFTIDPSLPNRIYPAESALRKQLGNRLTILRLTGLIGPKRHPAYYVSGKEIADDGSNPVNLIHSSDIVSAIETIVDEHHFGQTFNLVHPDHPSKKSYYTKAANHFDIDPPKYGEKHAKQRLIKGNAIERTTSFKYRYALNNFDDFLR